VRDERTREDDERSPNNVLGGKYEKNNGLSTLQCFLLKVKALFT